MFTLRDLEQLKWLYRMTQTKIKVEAISLIHDTWNRIIVLCGLYDFHFCTRIACVWPRNVLKSHMQAIFFFEVTRLVETEFEDTLKIFEVSLRLWNISKTLLLVTLLPKSWQFRGSVILKTSSLTVMERRTMLQWQCLTSDQDEPFCMQQCDQFCTTPDLRVLLRDNAGVCGSLFIYGDAVYPPPHDIGKSWWTYGKAWKAAGLHR